jgi:hypothetical protein
MNVLRSRGRLVRTALLLLVSVLGIATATVAVPATPAQAGPGFMLCLPVYDEGGTKIIDWDCHWYDLPIEIPCPPCPDWGLEFDHLVNPPDQWYVEDLLDGLDLLEQAALNPREADRFRAMAQREFMSSAQRADDPGIQLGTVGRVDRERNVIESDPHPWLVAAGTDLADGLRLMHRALKDPEPSPWIEAAMDQFEEAYQEIAQQRPIGR